MKRKSYGSYFDPQGYRKAKASKKVRKSKRPAKVQPIKASSFSAPSTSSFVGTRLRANLIYAEKGISINPGAAGATGVYVFSLNSLFDPNVTGTGHQPTNFDQIMAIYEDYQVVSVKYKVSINNDNTATPALVGVTITDQPSTNIDPLVYMENGMTQFKTLTGKTESGYSIAEFAGQAYLADIHGKRNQEYLADDVYRGTQTTSPNEQAYLHIWAADVSSGDPGALGLVVHIEYDTIFTGGKLNLLS